MKYFNTKQLNIFNNVTIQKKYQEKLDYLLSVLSESNVGEIIEKEKLKNAGKGRPSEFNPFDMFAAIIYAFSVHSGSLRKTQESIENDLRFIYLMNGLTPTYPTICNYINTYILPHAKEIFGCLTKEIKKRLEINCDVAFVDGTKIEANANRYSIVYKPTKRHNRLDDNIKKLLLKYFKISENKLAFESSEIANYFTRLSNDLEKLKANKAPNDEVKLKIKDMENDIKLLNEYLTKSLNYEEMEQICGPDRNSYYKNDHDATGICLKNDYYAGLGSSLRAAYNIQIIVSNGLILDYLLTQSRNDVNDFIPLMKDYYKIYKSYPKNICADAGYGSHDNYKYIDDHKIGNYIKYNKWELEKNGKYIDCFSFDDKGQLKCLNGKIAITSGEILTSHPHNKYEQVYFIDDCTNCKYKDYCYLRKKDKDRNDRYFYVDKYYWEKKEEAKKNLITPKGIEIRINRSCQVEGAFGVIKQDMDYDRFRRVGLEKVSCEFMLVCLGRNIRKLLSVFDETGSVKYWTAPDDLKPDKIKTFDFNKAINKKPKQDDPNSKLKKEYQKRKKEERYKNK